MHNIQRALQVDVDDIMRCREVHRGHRRRLVLTRHEHDAVQLPGIRNSPRRRAGHGIRVRDVDDVDGVLAAEFCLQAGERHAVASRGERQGSRRTRPVPSPAPGRCRCWLPTIQMRLPLTSFIICFFMNTVTSPTRRPNLRITARLMTTPPFIMYMRSSKEMLMILPSTGTFST